MRAETNCSSVEVSAAESTATKYCCGALIRGGGRSGWRGRGLPVVTHNRLGGVFEEGPFEGWSFERGRQALVSYQ